MATWRAGIRSSQVSIDPWDKISKGTKNNISASLSTAMSQAGGAEIEKNIRPGFNRTNPCLNNSHKTVA